MADPRTTTRQQEMIIPDHSQSQSGCPILFTMQKLIPDGGRAITDDAPLMEGDSGPDGSGAATKGTPPMEDREFHGPVT
ncbi:Hypp7271 [Branchiostoma lanceolatum]|uniref:Hypp7271 protein n=1 Tax=Branchiostoma lanceolatum TaxID=7740 RepID=A0A8J9YYV3_BRALA|nr:Hypp7271 [Branchiostoma lanceolatum]